MMSRLVVTAMLCAGAGTAHAAAPAPLPSTGMLIVLPATGTVRQANDQVTVIMTAEETNKDKAVAQSRVNLKMKQGLALLKQADPQASFKTESYYTYPVYPEQINPPATQPRVPNGWRVTQSLRVTTTNLAALPKTVAAGQGVLGLSNLYFGLAPATFLKLDDERIAATYANLNQRVRAVAAAMGRDPADAVVEVMDFEGSGNYAGSAPPAPPPAPAALARAAAPAVEEPSFEPGETTLNMRAVGKVRFK